MKLFKTIKDYLISVIAEFKHVSFLSRDQVIKATWTVILASSVSIIILAGIDIVATGLLQKFFIK